MGTEHLTLLSQLSSTSKFNPSLGLLKLQKANVVKEVKVLLSGAWAWAST